jgi:hypothetical protein
LVVVNLRRAARTLASLFVMLVALGSPAEARGGSAGAEARRPQPTLPADVPETERVRLREIVEDPSVSTKVSGGAFTARREIFEYLLDHPEFASHVARTLRTARYRIWRSADGLQLDDGWGTVGQFDVVHAARGLRVMYARGQYKARLLPDISGQAVVVIEYGYAPAADGKSVVSTAVTGFVRIDSRVLATAGRVARPAAEAKADKEALRLVRVFAKTTRAIEENPGAVYDQLRQRPGVPAQELEEFRQLLKLP